MNNYTITDAELLRRLYEYSQKDIGYDPDNATKGHMIAPGADERDTFLHLLTNPDCLVEYFLSTPNRIDTHLPKDPPGSKLNRGEKIVILGIDDTHLISRGPGYPMIYGDYLRVLEKIRTTDPTFPPKTQNRKDPSHA